MSKTSAKNQIKMEIEEAIAEYELFHLHESEFISSLHYGDKITFEDIREMFDAGKYQLVSTFQSEGYELDEELEHIFRISQNHEESWRGHGRDPCRSTSIGDIVRVGPDYWIVAPVGFDLGWRDRKH